MMQKVISYISGHRAGVCLLAIVTGGLFLRLLCVDVKPLWYDEACSVSMSQKALTLQNFSYLLSYKPLYFVFLRAWSSFFGVGEFSVRLPSVIFGVMAIPGIYYLGRELVDRKTGLIAAFLLAGNSFHVYHSQQARHFTLLVLVVILSYVCFFRAFRQGNEGGGLSRYVFLNIFFNVMMVFLHPYAWTIVLSQLISVFICIEKSFRRAWFPFQLIGILFVIFWGHIVNKGQIWHNIWWVPPPGVHVLWETLQTFAYGGPRYGLDDYQLTAGYSWLIVILFTLLMFFLLRGILVLFTVRTSAAVFRPILLIWLFFPVMLAWGISFLKPIYIIKHLILCLPVFCLITAVGVVSSGERWKIMVSLGVIFIVGLYPLSLVYSQDGNVNWRMAVDEVKHSMGPDDALIVTTSSELAPFLYYFGKDPGLSLRDYASSYYCRMEGGVCRDVFLEQGHRVMGIPQNQGQHPDYISYLFHERWALWNDDPPHVIWLMASRWVSREDKLYIMRSLDLAYRREKIFSSGGIEVIKFVML